MHVIAFFLPVSLHMYDILAIHEGHNSKWEKAKETEESRAEKRQKDNICIGVFEAK